MRVALIGLGDIAEKAYLPVLATRPDLDLRLVTRDTDALTRIGAAYRLTHRFAALDDALDAGLDAAFVHAATNAHDELASTLLHAGVPTYVDKPLDLHAERARELVTLAAERGVTLMVGFNRRYAPAYRELASWPDRRVVLMQKNRTSLAGEPRAVVFDDFIHVVDTLRFLGSPEPEQVDVTAGVDETGLLTYLAVTLRAQDRIAIGVMSRTAGVTEEVLEVIGDERKRRVVELAEVTRYEGAERVSRRDEWRPVGEQRGFAQICDAFLDAVRSGQVLDAADALATHELCEWIVAEITGSAR